MTGWGQSGPLAQAAGHDLNYIALTGALHAIGGRRQAGAAAQPGRRLRRRRAVPGDRRAGGAARAHAVRPGPGGRRGDGRRRRVADVDLLRHDGQRPLERPSAAPTCSTAARPSTAPTRRPTASTWRSARSSPSSSPRWPQRIGLDARFIKGQHDRKLWPEMRAEMTRLLRGKTRDEWCALLEGSDACFAPVLTIAEAPQHPHAAARGSLHRGGRRGAARPGAALRPQPAGAVRPAPAPARTPTRCWPRPASAPTRSPRCMRGAARR